jgi:MICOS complex subunit MIC12
LTCATLYFTAAIHTRNRTQQSILLRQQAQLLKGVIEPIPVDPEPAARELPVGLTEMAKDKWNRELEYAVWKVYETDWKRVREGLEDRVGNVIEKIRDGGK